MKEIEQSTSSPISTEEKESTYTPTYNILEYCKKEPSVALTCISALVVIISFLANTAAFIRESSFLRYWDIDSIYASLSSANQLYRVLGNIVYAISVMLAISIINGAYEAYIPAKRLIISLTEVIRSNRSDATKLSKKGKKVIEKARRIRRQNPKLRIKGDARMIRELEKLNKEALDSVNTAYEESKSLKKSLRMEMLVHFIIAGMILAIGSTFFALVGSGTSISIWGYLFLNILMMVILYLICVFTHRKDINKKEIRKDALQNMRKYLDELLKDEHEYPLERKWSDNFSDSAIVGILISAIVYVSIFFIMFSSLGYDEAKKRDSFPITDIDGQTYAIIYNTGENVILEECTLVDSASNPVDFKKDIPSDVRIDIITQKQRIIGIDGLNYRIIEFDREGISKNGVNIFPKKPSKNELKPTEPNINNS